MLRDDGCVRIPLERREQNSTGRHLPLPTRSRISGCLELGSRNRECTKQAQGHRQALLTGAPLVRRARGARVRGISLRVKTVDFDTADDRHRKLGGPDRFSNNGATLISPRLSSSGSLLIRRCIHVDEQYGSRRRRARTPPTCKPHSELNSEKLAIVFL